MPPVRLDVSVGELLDAIAQLPPHDILWLAEAIEEEAETRAMMRVAETGFREWNEEGEDVYDAAVHVEP